MSLLPWISKPRFVSWDEYRQKVEFLDRFHFQQSVRRHNVADA
ncbi:MAG: hypothetical protein ACOCWQ_00105 [Nanoarchaeota archaeon]